MLSPKASATTRLIIRWTRFWNSYDLDELEALFVMDERVTYFSSEKQGLLRGPEALRRHHAGFGFVPGGKVSANSLWLEQVAEDRLDRGATLITAIWCFRRASAPDIVQRGPLSAVVVRTRRGPRIAHMNFSTYSRNS
jgi:hypothetical protein